MTWRHALGVLLIIIGLIGIAVGVLYITTNAHSLPTWFPGYMKSLKAGKHTQRGEAGIAAGAVVFIVGVLLVAFGRRRRRRW